MIIKYDGYIRRLNWVAFLILSFGLTACLPEPFERNNPNDPGSSTFLDNDGDSFSTAQDCDDTDSGVNPSASEICNEVDDDCNGDVDDGLPINVYYDDLDGDGYGSDDAEKQHCGGARDDEVVTGGDCDDDVAAVNPNAEESCDDEDNDCDGDIDEGVTETYYRDSDGDGYGTTSKELCSREPGYAAQSGDCDDKDSDVHPGTVEVCDTIDNDCDGITDEGFALETWYPDNDGDSFGSNDGVISCDSIEGSVLIAGDCNDNDSAINPAASEECDGEDNDCDGLSDENLPTSVWYRDQDNDQYGSIVDSVTDCQQPEGYTVVVGGDCDDNDASVNPKASEICDAKDNNCDGAVDEGLTNTWFEDLDDDEYGNSGLFIVACESMGTYSTQVAGDCDDQDNSVYPTAVEVCDTKDNDCDESIDEELPINRYWPDEDGDNYGTGSENSAYIEDCGQPEGYSSSFGDCNDSDADIYPGAPEYCDGKDNDCDGAIDNDVTYATWYEDADGDSYGNAQISQVACLRPDGYVLDDSDCNDNAVEISPAASEACDGVDNDCDDMIDEGVTITWYIDGDNDGFGDANGVTQESCTMPIGYAESAQDCNDTDGTIYPGADVVCDGQDRDCDGETEAVITFYLDADRDLFGDSDLTVLSSDDDVLSCTPPDGYAATGDDCDDDDESVYPGAAEVCDGNDNDCDGSIDEGLSNTVFYRDSDTDNYGNDAETSASCIAPTGYVETAGDCDDSNSETYPDAAEVCDAEDNDCDGTADEEVTQVFYLDYDGDGFGTDAEDIKGCDIPAGYVAIDGDCDDFDPLINPDAEEICDQIDNNCDKSVDEGVSVVAYQDVDGDTFGGHVAVAVCAFSDGYVENNDDCDDGDANVYPGAMEVFNATDDDCDYIADNEISALETAYRTVEGSSDAACNDSRIALSAYASELYATDLDNDQTEDLFVRYSLEDGFGYCLWRGQNLASGSASAQFEISDAAVDSLVGVGDFNGDSILDLAIAYETTSSSTSVAIWLGSEAGWFGSYTSGAADISLNAKSAEVSGIEAADLYQATGELLDTDELILAHPDTNDDTGSVDIYYFSDVPKFEFLASVTGTLPGDRFGAAMAPDASSTYFWIAAPQAAYVENGDAVGAIYYVDLLEAISRSDTQIEDEAERIVINRDVDLSSIGDLLESAGDVDGDAIDDLMLNATRASSTSVALIVQGKELSTGGVTIEYLDETSIEYSSGNHLGLDLSAAADIDEDGYADFLISGIYESDFEIYEASVNTYLVYGGPTFFADGLTLETVAGATFTGPATASYGAQAQWVRVADDASGFGLLLIGAPGYVDNAGNEIGLLLTLQTPW